MEETGVSVENPVYLESKWFQTDDGTPVVDVVFFCTYAGREARAIDLDELAETLWLTAAEVAAHSKAPVWTRQTIERLNGSNWTAHNLFGISPTPAA